MSRPMVRTRLVAVLLVAAVLFVWFEVAHPLGRACLVETSPGSFVLVDVAGNQTVLKGQAPAAPVTCGQP